MPLTYCSNAGDRAIEAALKMRISHVNLKGNAPIDCLAACHSRASSAIASGKHSTEILQCLARWQQGMSQQAVQLLMKDDEDDLYFTNGGQQTRNFLDGLVSRQFARAAELNVRLLRRRMQMSAH